MNWLNRERKKHVYGTDLTLLERMTQCLMKYGIDEEKVSVILGEQNESFRKFMKENGVCGMAVSKKTCYDTLLALILMYMDELNIKEQIIKDYS